MALKVSNKSRKKEKVMFPDPFKSSEFKKVFEVEVGDMSKEEVKEFLDKRNNTVIINYLVTEEDLELYKILENSRDDDVSIVIFWISIIAISVIGLLL